MTSHLTHYCIFFFSQNLIYNKEVQRLSHIQSSRAALYKTVQIKCSSSKYWTSAAFLLFTFKWSVKLFTVNRTIASNTWSCSLSLSSFIPVQIKFEFLLWKNTSNIVSFHWTAEKRKGKKGIIKVKLESFQHFLLGSIWCQILKDTSFPFPCSAPVREGRQNVSACV